MMPLRVKPSDEANADADTPHRDASVDCIGPIDYIGGRTKRVDCIRQRMTSRRTS